MLEHLPEAGNITFGKLFWNNIKVAEDYIAKIVALLVVFQNNVRDVTGYNLFCIPHKMATYIEIATAQIHQSQITLGRSQNLFNGRYIRVDNFCVMWPGAW